MKNRTLRPYFAAMLQGPHFIYKKAPDQAGRAPPIGTTPSLPPHTDTLTLAQHAQAGKSVNPSPRCPQPRTLNPNPRPRDPQPRTLNPKPQSATCVPLATPSTCPPNPQPQSLGKAGPNVHDADCVVMRSIRRRHRLARAGAADTDRPSTLMCPSLGWGGGGLAKADRLTM
jgi:hypothetical protein